jgi:hypothetical protein
VPANKDPQQTMKTTLTCLAIIACALAFAKGVKAQGYIVPNGVTYIGLDFVGAYETQVLQNPTNGDYTAFLLKPQNQTTFAFDVLTDEGVRVFGVSPNDPISLQPILANSYPELTAPNSYVFPEGSPFYLGLYTGYDPWDSHGNYTGIYRDPVFAWGEFVNNGGAIQMLDSALEYGGGGIYAGTENIIPAPEPSIFGLSTLGALLLGWRALGRRQ